MNGTVGPLGAILPYGQCTLVVAGAHNGFIWAWRMRDGYLLGLKDRVPVLARLQTFVFGARWCVLLYMLTLVVLMTGSYSRIVDEHIDSELFFQIMCTQ
jgi:hypothetical protein